MIETSPNPYNPDQPTIIPEYFFGREETFAFIRQRLLTSNQPQTIALLGGQRIGKTSLFYQLRYHIEARFVLAYVDLGILDFSQPDALFLAMASAAHQGFEEVGVSTYRLPEIPEHVDDAWAWFSETYLAMVIAILRRNRRILFMFDNLSALLDALDQGHVPASLPETLSTLMAGEDRLDMLFVVDTRDEARLANFLPLADPMLHHRLPVLDDSAAADLTRQPVAETYHLTDSAVDSVLSMTGGHPYLLHCVNRLLWLRSASRGHRGLVTEDDVRTVLSQAVHEAEPLLRLAWDESNSEEQQVLVALAALTAQRKGEPIPMSELASYLTREYGQSIDASGLAAALRHLEYRNIAQGNSNNQFNFMAGLQYQWLRGQGITQLEPEPLARAIATSRPRPRWLPLLTVLILLGLLSLLLNQMNNRPLTESAAVVEQTVTLSLDMQASRQAFAQTQTFIARPTLTPTPTVTHTATNTPVPPTATPTGTATLTLTASPSLTPTYTASATRTPTLTLTSSVTPTASPSLSSTPSASATATSTPSATMTSTPTSTATVTATATLTPTVTPTPTPTLTPPPFPTAQIRATATVMR